MSFLHQERHGHVLLLTMSSPETRNALTSDEQFADFETTCAAVNDDMSVRVVVLTGEGSAFCAGGNVKDMRDRNGLFCGDPFDQAEAYRKGIQRIPRAIHALNVPVIRIASEKAMFAESFVKLGIIPGDGGAWFLPRAVGYSNACKMAFSGDPVRAPEALSMGLVSEVMAPEQLLERSLELAQSIASNPPHAVRLTKQLMRASEKSSLDELLDKSASFQALCHAEPDHGEAVLAFFDKRQGNYRES